MDCIPKSAICLSRWSESVPDEWTLLGAFLILVSVMIALFRAANRSIP